MRKIVKNTKQNMTVGQAQFTDLIKFSKETKIQVKWSIQYPEDGRRELAAKLWTLCISGNVNVKSNSYLWAKTESFLPSWMYFKWYNFVHELKILSTQSLSQTHTHTHPSTHCFWSGPRITMNQHYLTI